MLVVYVKVMILHVQIVLVLQMEMLQKIVIVNVMELHTQMNAVIVLVVAQD